MLDTLAILARVVMFACATLLPIINPVGAAPIFLSMTPGAPEPLRSDLARRIAQYSLLLLVGAMLAGSYVLYLFGLSLAVVKIAGGLLVVATAWHLLRAEHGPDADIPPASSSVSAEQIASSSFYPLTFPLTVGPGSVSVAVTLGAGIPVTRASELISVLGALVGMVIVSLTIYLCYRFASRLVQRLGRTGTIVVLRLSAFILLSVGVQILSDGLVERFEGLGQNR